MTPRFPDFGCWGKTLLGKEIRARGTESVNPLSFFFFAPLSRSKNKNKMLNVTHNPSINFPPPGLSYFPGWWGWVPSQLHSHQLRTRSGPVLEGRFVVGRIISCL
jgi:hypothetical protein